MLDSAAEYLRTAPFAVFAFSFAIPAVLAGIMAWAAIWSGRNARALAAMKDTTVDALAEGVALVSGTTAAPPPPRRP
ncbi:MAG: hypothetical protein N2422_02565 [Rhodobacteraceae bacterium]|nr:hypothetical protein [Paracoccaceae bacterium]